MLIRFACKLEEGGRDEVDIDTDGLGDREFEELEDDNDGKDEAGKLEDDNDGKDEAGRLGVTMLRGLNCILIVVALSSVPVVEETFVGFGIEVEVLDGTIFKEKGLKGVFPGGGVPPLLIITSLIY